MTSPQPDFDPMDTSDCFTHTPLDLQRASIRLLQLRAPYSYNRMIECNMIDTTPDDQYTCLSYVWGDETSGEWILVNGQKFWVRQNLWNFLDRARHDHRLNTEQLWIDALCIDQENVAERQHQVWQMGDIYANAEVVVSWLGIEADLVEFLIESGGANEFIIDNMNFYRSPYWSRAWITQEIVLGREVWLMARNHMWSLDELLSKSEFYAERGPYFSRVLWTRLNYMRVLRKARKFDVPLHEVLDRFKAQKCHLRRDRIFSLLALCSLDKTINIDYSSADIDIAIDVLQSYRDRLCLCFIDLITTTLGTPSPQESEFYPYGPGHLIAHGSVSLPVFRPPSDDFEDLDFIQCSCESESHSICGDKRPSKVEIFPCNTSTPESIRKRISLNLSKVCSTYCGLAVIWIDPEKDGFSSRYFGSYGGGKLMTMSSTIDVDMQKPHHGSACKVKLPLEFWIQMGAIAERHSHDRSGDEHGLGLFCDRVNGGETPYLQFQGSLKLHLDISHRSADVDME